MDQKTKILIMGVIIALVVSFALGRYTRTGTTTMKTETKTDEIKSTDTHQKETITEVKKPDGTVTTVTTIDTVKDQVDKIDSDTVSKTTTTKGSSKINISALAATSIHSPLGPPAYGISVSKEFIGPITIGAFGLTTGVVGVSIGLNF